MGASPPACTPPRAPACICTHMQHAHACPRVHGACTRVHTHAHTHRHPRSPPPACIHTHRGGGPAADTARTRVEPCTRTRVCKATQGPVPTLVAPRRRAPLSHTPTEGPEVSPVGAALEWGPPGAAGGSCPVSPLFPDIFLIAGKLRARGRRRRGKRLLSRERRGQDFILHNGANSGKI